MKANKLADVNYSPQISEHTIVFIRGSSTCKSTVDIISVTFLLLGNQVKDLLLTLNDTLYS